MGDIRSDERTDRKNRKDLKNQKGPNKGESNKKQAHHGGCAIKG